MSADRELLFGFLALQNDCVSREDLIAGVQVWLQDKSKPLAEILVQRKSIDADECDLLLRLTARHLRRHGDDPQKSLAVLSSLGPLKNELQRLGDADIEASIRVVAERGPGGREPRSKPDLESTFVPPKFAESRFRILRPHARGGLGEVFVACDEQLNREVALKEIQSQFADDAESRGRFVLEAEVTGGLEHPGIVPVYGLGQYPDGRPYYAMRFIKGDSLKEAIEQFHGKAESGERKAAEAAPGKESSPRYDSLTFRKLLGRFIDVCQAISYAHSRGVLHRDLKPGNIMLGKYGETLVVDWGLAKVRDRSDGDKQTAETTLKPSSGSGMTPTVFGIAIGTPAYMPPEQASGQLDELGPASDIYSLGATLYHLLTGRAPFRGSDQGAILKDVQAGRFPLPTAVRTEAPRSLEAVCLKAMSLEPGNRYSSPHHMADDIEHYLADEPVSAFAEPIAVRARRWVRKNQTLATTTAAVLLVSAIGLGVFATVVSAMNAELTNSNDNLAAANEREHDARTLAETNEKSAREQSQLALATLTSVITDIQGGLAGVPGGGEIRRRLLTTSLQKLESVSVEFLSQAAVDRSTWLALNSMGDVILTFGTDPVVDPSLRRLELPPAADTSDSMSTERTKEHLSAVQLAESYYQRAFQIAKTLAEADPNESQKQRDLSISFNNLGEVFLKLGRTDDALTQFKAYEGINRVLAEADPNDAETQRSLSTSIERIGLVFEKIGETAKALETYERMIVIKKQLADNHPSDAVAQRELAVTHGHLGDVFLKLRRTDDALTEYQDTLKISRVLAEADPHDAEKQRDLSNSFSRLGDVFRTLGRADDALTQYQDALKISRLLAEADPNDAEMQRSMSFSFARLGDVFLTLGRTDDALTQYQGALKISRVLVEADPNDAQKQYGLLITLDRLGGAFLTLGRTDDALTQYQDALKISRALAEADPDDPQKQQDLAVSHYKLGTVRMARDEFSLAAESFNAAAQFQQTMIERDMNVDQAKLGLAMLETEAQSARMAEIALGDWETLLQKPAEKLPDLLDARGIQCSRRSRFADAAQAAAKLRELDNATNSQLYNAACVFSLCAASIKAAEGSELTAEQVIQRQTWMNDALASLKLSIDKGWTDFDHLQEDSDLTILRDLPEFKALIPASSPM